MRIYLCLALLVVASISGCDKTERKRAEPPKVSRDQEALAAAKSRVQQLTAQIDQLRIENQRLKTKNDFFASQNEILQLRLQQLIACYGTGIWDYGDDGNSPVFVKSMKGAGVRDVAAALNARFQKDKQPTITIKKKEGRTVVIGVDNEEQLGEQMGSNGALSYMTAVTYSLISVKNIECVSFDIGEREHVRPGTYCKDRLEPLTPQ